MIYTPLVNKALKIAYAAHKKQVDDSQIPYIFHPVHLAEQMDTETRTCVALLHDVVEDTTVTMEQLRSEFPETVINGLELLTHTPDKEYYDYVREICKNQDALFVKLADLIHNMDESRLCDMSLTEIEKNRWLEKYSKALYIVVQALEKDIPVNNSFENSNKVLLNNLLRAYRYPNRFVKIECGKNPMDYMTEKEFQLLSRKSIREQMRLISIDTNEKEIHDFRYLQKDEKRFSDRLEDYRFNKFLLVSRDVILGILRIDNECGYKAKNRVSYLWLNGELEIEEYRYINHSQDHMAVGQEISVCHMHIDIPVS